MKSSKKRWGFTNNHEILPKKNGEEQNFGGWKGQGECHKSLQGLFKKIKDISIQILKKKGGKQQKYMEKST